MLSLSKYRYGTLATEGEIRLLGLHAASCFEDPLIVRFRVLKGIAKSIYESIKPDPSRNYSLESPECIYVPRAGAYEAMSYAWGLDEKSKPISVATENGLHGLSIHTNVDIMLRHLKEYSSWATSFDWNSENEDSAGSCRWLWIDALCLNQEDVIEKEHQVQRMGVIYKHASRVLIWLGADDDDKATAHQVLSMLSGYQQWNDPKWWDSQVWKRRRYIESMKRFLSRRWFQRRWIVQEAALAPVAIVKCGKEELGFTWFAHGVSCILRRWKTELGEYQQIGRTLRIMQGSRCADDRDRLYALQTLHHTGITVCYTLSVLDTYQDFARAQIARSPELLYYSGAFSSNTNLLPS
ncbi:heterokaryon incompatibility protein-domain-containing protein [Lophiotrema nucula]|uniref:Heterokaryon incompatibility protein-domain-containing protein n=1 Tax=Lophiotrema nucula TaxID=690887 RepID=A0A6A5YJA8_9PLEO|nr:heterokaryon incompatibility protein-domain-containing protein [Lophiotrema nucula]